MKVFLVVSGCVNPKQTYREYPLGAGLVATELRRHGHAVSLYDQNAERPGDDALFARLREFQPDMVAFSVITPGYPAAQRQIERVRRDYPGMFIAAGGIHASLFPEDLLTDGADAVAPGAGCHVAAALADALAAGRPWRGLPGLVYRNPSGGLVRTTPAVPETPGEDPGIVDREVYRLPLYGHHSMLASLGCPHRCLFCCNYSGTMLQNGATIRSADRLLEELHYLVRRYAARRVFFVDDLFLLTPANVLAFCRRLIADGLPLEWIAQMRADTLLPEVADALAAAGCRRVYLGVEAGSDAILERVRKGFNKATVRRAVRCAKRAGLRVKTGWIFGLPGSRDEQYESLDFMRELRPHEISVHQLIPFPGTDYYRNPARYGLRIRAPKDFRSFCYGGLGDNVSFDYLPQAELVELLESTVAVLEAEGYVSSDRAAPHDKYVFSTPLNATSMNVFQPGR